MDRKEALETTMMIFLIGTVLYIEYLLTENSKKEDDIKELKNQSNQLNSGKENF